MSSGRVPAGYVQIDLPHARVVTRDHVAKVVATLLSDGVTLHEWASRQPGAKELRGREIAWAVELSGTGERVVVRHNRHGGLLAPMTGDTFLVPTRAPKELSIALELGRRGVLTPEIIGYAIYPALGPLLARSDVATREVPGAQDLGACLIDAAAGPMERRDALDATARLLGSLFRAGVRHHDLNVKNVLLARRDDGQLDGWLLDVDRVSFSSPRDARSLSKNVARLSRSIEKWRLERNARIDEDDLAHLLSRVSEVHA